MLQLLFSVMSKSDTMEHQSRSCSSTIHVMDFLKKKIMYKLESNLRVLVKSYGSKHFVVIYFGCLAPQS